MKHLLRQVVLACTFAALGTVAHSATLNLVETTDFDAVAPAGTSLGVLGVGTNRISGSISFECVPSANDPSRCGVQSGGDTSDRLQLTVADQTRLLAGSRLFVSNASYDGSIVLYLNNALVAFTFPSSNPGGTAIIDSLIAPTSGPLDFFFTLGGDLNQGVNSGMQSFDYEITLGVESLAPIPLPSSALLLLGALGIGAGLARKRRA